MPAHRRRSTALGDRALSDLRYIRTAMERSGEFTAVPGAGAVAMGAIGILAAFVSAAQDTPERWLAVWLAAAAIACLTGLWALLRKSRTLRLPAFAGPGRKFLLCFCPPLAAGAVLTAALARSQHYEALPAAWLLLYGAATVAAGVCSPRAVTVTGAGFMALGTLAAIGPASWGNVLLAAGFGVLHVASGLYIARVHGG